MKNRTQRKEGRRSYPRRPIEAIISRTIDHHRKRGLNCREIAGAIRTVGIEKVGSAFKAREAFASVMARDAVEATGETYDSLVVLAAAGGGGVRPFLALQGLASPKPGRKRRMKTPKSNEGEAINLPGGVASFGETAAMAVWQIQLIALSRNLFGRAQA